LVLGFSVGTPVALSGAEKRRDLPGGLAEYAMTASSGDDHFELRTVADTSGEVRKVIASSESIPDHWHEEP
jgi:hypothetical protein